MFTGIVETMGTVVTIEKTGGGSNASRRLRLAGHLSGEPLVLGESIAVDGVCQTVTEVYPDGFGVEVMERTVELTTFADLRPGRVVNLERALTLGSRLGGHLVTGHVDGLGKVSTVQKLPGSTLVRITVPDAVGVLCVPRGSITVSGVSLTIAGLGKDWIEVSLAGTTWAVTTLKTISPGTRVNLETDIIGKYVKKFLSALSAGHPGKRNDAGQSAADKKYMKLLQEEGFI
jgi:riboflavin synthase